MTVDGQQLFLVQVQSSLRKSIRRGAERVGPFLVHFDEHSDNPFRNYAIPDQGAEPSAADIAALIAAFAGRNRQPRLEYVAPAPVVDEALSTAGFAVDLQLPLMTVTAEDFHSPDIRRDVRLIEARSEEDLRSAAQIQHIAYGEPGDLADADVSRLRATVDHGGVVMLAICAGEPAGAGLATPPDDGLAEIAGVGVLPDCRRGGVASAVVAALTRSVFAAGATPYLQTETANEQRLYGRLGYRTIGELTATSLSATALRVATSPDDDRARRALHQ